MQALFWWCTYFRYSYFWCCGNWRSFWNRYVRGASLPLDTFETGTESGTFDTWTVGSFGIRTQGLPFHTWTVGAFGIGTECGPFDAWTIAYLTTESLELCVRAFWLEVGIIGGGGITGPFPPTTIGVTVRVLTTI